MIKSSWATRLHKAANSLDRRFGPALRRSKLLEKAWIRILDLAVAQQSDRRYMRQKVLPALAGSRASRVLFVGVRGYTRRYGAAFINGPTEFWTCDIDPEAARYGTPDRHLTADARRLDAAFEPAFFDAVVMNGVFGWGVDTPSDMNRSLQGIERVLVPGGVLLLGWNSDRSQDPDTLEEIALFQPTGFSGLPHRKGFDDVTHVYAWYRASS